MGRVVKLRMSGHGPDTDAPSVKDVLDQVRDYLELLLGVEEAVAGGSQTAVVWRIIHASQSSPLAFDLEAFPVEYAVNIDHRVAVVLSEVAAGLNSLQTKAERPRYFTNKALGQALGLFRRVTNGLSLSDADFGTGLPPIRLTPNTARIAAENVQHILTPVGRPYKEVGSVEGYFRGVETDGFGRKIVVVKDRVTGHEVKCIVATTALPAIATHEIGEVWNNRRVQVFGRLHYKGPGKLDYIDANGVRFFRDRSELPQPEDIVDPEFTGGLRSEEYMERLRDGSLP
jgi:hypothetical protein